MEMAQCIPDTQAQLKDKLVPTVLSAGQWIHRIGDPAQQVFFIREGVVRIGAISAVGKEFIVRALGPGDWFGFKAQGVVEIGYRSITYNRARL